MKHIVATLVQDALAELPELAEAAGKLAIETTVERTRDASHGDFASNIAMRLAKAARKNPREIAASIVAALGDSHEIDKVEIAGPGFINFYLNPTAFHVELETALRKGADYGRQPLKEGPKILLEFVSANPTGPLHVGHGRLAAFGATVGNLLAAAGYPVTREYYVNDAGYQIEQLTRSAYFRYLEALGAEISEEAFQGLFPGREWEYRGDYLKPVGQALKTKYGESLAARNEQTGAWDGRAVAEWFDPVRAFTVGAMMDLIRDDLGAPQQARAEERDEAGSQSAGRAHAGHVAQPHA